MSVQQRTFAELRPHCSSLVGPTVKDSSRVTHLKDLRDTLLKLDGAALQTCWEYILFPLFFILDQHSRDAKDASKTTGRLKTMEGVFACLSVLFQKCSVPSKDFSTLLGRICSFLDLPRDQSSEEVRDLVLDCVAALLEGMTHDMEVEKPQLASVGYCAHMLLKTAESEVQAGLVGSKAIRVKALQAIKSLIEAQRRCKTEDALAHLLPGLFSGLTKGLQDQEGSEGLIPKSGAAHSGKAHSLCIEALAALTCTVFHNLPAPAPRREHQFDMQADDPQAVLLALQKLEQHARKPPQLPQHTNPLSEPASETAHTTGEGQTRRNGIAGSSPPLTIERTQEWCEGVTQKLCERLNLVLPPLVAHPSPQVRTSVAQGVIQLLKECNAFLQPSQKQMLQILFSLAQDDWPSVSEPCLEFFGSVCIKTQGRNLEQLPSSAGKTGAVLLSQSIVLEIFSELLQGFTEALAVGSQHGALHARKLTTAFQLLGPQSVEQLARNPVQRNQIVQALLDAFAFDPAATELLYHPLSQTRVSAKKNASLAGPEPLLLTESNPASLLPRMPMGLQYITTEENYRSASELCRTLGRLSAAEGGSAFQSLLSCLMTSLHECISNSSEPHHTASWQFKAAAVVTLTTELLHGASEAWKPRVWISKSSEPLSKEACLAVVFQIQQELLRPELWELSTHNHNAADQSPSGKAPLTLQALNANIVLSKSLLEAIGTCAAACGAAYADSGGLMRAALLPLVERLGDPCQAVTASAVLAVSVLCQACDYDGLRMLVTRNIDYIVDGVCYQLREIDSHPRAPYLFATLLRMCGVGPELMTILSEPTRQAVCGLSIASRHRQPQYVVSFLITLREIMLGAVEAAGQIAKEMQDLAECTAQRMKDLKAELEAQDPDRANLSFGFDKDSLRKTEEYFKQRQDDPDLDGGAPDPEEVLVNWDSEEWSSIDRLHTRLHSVASLSASVTEATSPLLTSKTLTVVLLSLEVSALALKVLQHTTAALDAREYQIEPLLAKQNVVVPVKPETPKVLPHVHQFWGPLMAALQDDRPHVIEGGLNALVDLSVVSGGDFLAQRMRKEALPVMHRLLRDGPAQQLPKDTIHRPLVASYEGHAPAVVARTRQAVLSAMRRIAEGTGRSAIKLIAADLTCQALQFLPSTEIPVLRAEAEKVIRTVAQEHRQKVIEVLESIVRPEKHLSNGFGDHETKTDEKEQQIVLADSSQQLQRSLQRQRGDELRQKAAQLLEILHSVNV